MKRIKITMPTANDYGVSHRLWHNDTLLGADNELEDCLDALRGRRFE